MDDEEVEDVGTCQEEPVVLISAPGFIETAVQLGHGCRCRERRHGREADSDGAVGALFGDEVVRVLPAAARLWRELVEVAVELQEDVRGERDVFCAGMNRVEDSPVAGDLGLGAVARCRLLRYQLLESPLRGGDVLDRVGGFHALDQGELLERLERGGMLPRKRFLASAADIDFAQLAVERRGDQVEVPTEVAERLHAEKLPARTPQVWVDRVTTHSC